MKRPGKRPAAVVVASLTRRMLAGVVDGGICAAAAATPWLAGLFSLTVLDPPDHLYFLDHLLVVIARTPMVFINPVLVFGLMTALWQFGWTYFWAGRTPGMALVKIHVIEAHGKPPGAVQTALRAGSHLLSSLSLGLGWLWILFTPHRRSWPDLFSDTWTIKTPPKRPRSVAAEK